MCDTRRCVVCGSNNICISVNVAEIVPGDVSKQTIMLSNFYGSEGDDAVWRLVIIVHNLVLSRCIRSYG